MTEAYPKTLDSILSLSEANEEAARDLYRALQDAQIAANSLVGHYNAARAAIDSSGQLINQDIVATDMAAEHAARALAVHQAAGFGPGNDNAITAQKLFGEGSRRISHVRSGLGVLHNELLLGPGTEVDAMRWLASEEITSGTGAAMSMAQFLIDAYQELTRDTNEYKERRIKETEVVQAADEYLVNARIMLDPGAENSFDVSISGDAPPTAKGLAEKIDAITVQLAPAGEALQGVPADLTELRQLHEDAGRVLMDWPNAPGSTVENHRKLGALIEALTLTISAGSFTEIDNLLTASKTQFESIQKETNDALKEKAYIWETLSLVIKALIRYRRRRH